MPFCPLSTFTAFNKDVNLQKLMPQFHILLSPPREPLSSLLLGEGGTSRPLGVILCGDLSESLSLLRAEGLTFVNPTFQVGKPGRACQGGHLQREGKKCQIQELSLERVRSQRPGSVGTSPLLGNLVLCVPRATGGKTLNKGSRGGPGY